MTTGKVVHCKRESHDVYIGRPSIWGNPYSHLPNTKAEFRVSDREEAIAFFEAYLTQNKVLMCRRHELRGKVLGCWCSPKTCHGDVLLKHSNRIFVFGSNLAGRHGKGAALHAREWHGAVYGQGVGLQGSSYGIPTKNADLRVLAVNGIEQGVQEFLQFAAGNPSLSFQLTRIGCGLAGYTDEEIAPLFSSATENVIFPEEWSQWKPKRS